jgi:predicted transcriptional regulator of viral defense system
MLALIKAREGGLVFTPTDFLDLGSRHAVDKALSRMAAAGTIRRISRGLYDVPSRHPIVGIAGPSIDNFAKALAAKRGTRMQPTGAYAANLLGLSDQVPAKVVFLTDGRSRRVRLDKLDIVFRQTSPRNMATAGRISGLVIQALRYLGKTHVNDVTVARLNRNLSAENKEQLIEDVNYAPAWIGRIIRQLAAKK